MIARVRTSLALLALAGSALLAGCERPPINAVQHGFRGTGMDEIYNPRTLARQAPNNTLPEVQAPASPDGPKAGTIYKNLQVLGDLSIGELARHMVSITSWVAPKEGCTYCHDGENFALDAKYTKVVARRMLQMTRHINADWKDHVVQTGVTCFTCHRGNPVPANIWFTAPPARQAAAGRMLGNNAGQNMAAKTVGLSSLPYDPFTPFLLQDGVARIQGDTALPTGNRKSLKQAEWVYGMMMHMSDSLGVNCTFCHNTQAFGNWSGSTPQRARGWYGIQMARELNNDYLAPLVTTLPAQRLGPTGDAPKLNCATCHQGAYKPLYGASMLASHPELIGVPAVAASDGSGTADGAMLFFAVGSATLSEGAARHLTALIESLKAKPGAKAAITGYTSAAGDPAANQDLAKQRAFAVRDALSAAGIGAARVVLEKPASVEANVAGEDPKSRRVEVALK